MKIVFLIDQFYKHGGIEKILGQKLNYLAVNTNFEVILITVNQKNSSFVYPISNRIKHYDLNVQYKESKSYYHPLNWTNLIRHFIKLIQLLRYIKPEVAVSVQFFPDQYLLPFMKIKKTIKEIHFNGEAIHKGLNKIDFLLFHKIVSRYSYLVVLNNDEINYYKGFKNIRVIPNFISNQIINTTIVSERKKVIIAAGRIAPVKQFDHLIKAFSLIADKNRDWSLEIYGNEDGIVSNDLRVLIEKCGLQNQVFIHPAIDYIFIKMKESSLFALSSKTECFPMVLLEAQQAGLPIISYDCKNGPKNIVNHLKDGLLVVDQNIDELAHNLEILIKDEALRNKLSQNAIKNVKRFEENEIMKNWISLYQS
jgi:glycosyltransferase involved in cell wall biosynthesis